MKRWLRPAAAVFASSYLAALVAVIVALRFGGERFWATALALYLPRIAFLAPLPFTTLALWVFGPRKLLVSQVAAALLVLFPLMGLVVPSIVRGARADRPSFRVLSFNVDSLNHGADDVAAAIEAERPDLVLIQELGTHAAAFIERLQRTFGAVHVSTQFVVASRFPIEEVTDPPRIPYYGKGRSPRFMRYVIATPLGRAAIYNVHPISPRWGFHSLRGQGFRYEIESGRLFSEEHSEPLREDIWLRVLQVRTFAERARAEALPVLIAGDTNLPSLSPILSENLSSFTDGFGRAGAGFGYTFPSRYPFMRIDRILTSSSLEFSTFRVSCRGVSDHLCVVADVRRAE
jgi:vancomycin resistance protein VanJ